MSFALGEKVSRIDIVHLILVESSYLHLDGILSLLLLERSHLLLKLNSNGFGVSVRACIGVIFLFIIFFLLLFFVSELEAILVVAGLMLLCTSCRKGLFLILVEVEVSSEFWRLRLPEVRIWVDAACCGLVESAVGEYV